MDEGTLAALPTDIDELHRIIIDKDNLIAKINSQSQNALKEKDNLIAILLERIRLLEHKRFGRKKEDIDYSQSLFDEAELEVSEGQQQEPVTQIEVKSHTRTRGGGRKPLPENLPREEVVIDLPDEEKRCTCGCELQRIGEERSEKPDIIPAQFKVIVTVRPKYACKNCAGEGSIKTSPVPPVILPKIQVTSGFLAYIIVSKFCDALPLHRQEKILKSRYKIDIDRKEMSRWLIALSRKIEPITDLLMDNIRAGPYLLMDETRLQVLKEADKSDTSLSYTRLLRGSAGRCG